MNGFALLEEAFTLWNPEIDFVVKAYEACIQCSIYLIIAVVNFLLMVGIIFQGDVVAAQNDVLDWLDDRLSRGW